ncbi:DegT/DnrJ/EryC1/StrS family aminotransferase [Pseudoalteromonas piscicida]|uniref:DegT/DnrJ/EryC1/StrS family aminotransferase n=1 Tax=Pseudoalteromonas piscicida TaxID=43662 RepID=A0AAD0REW3_PSEO7|nr:DegT/DnrJ/EryC1/StrS family aminotransferase [Pseudoalteromonas piscicida]ASD68137.1 hypothetical protein B1L02_14690 [Pseudoalteromonas piscicida]AXQ99077.1 DegT/DnrJ/EryC1/StrS family aminotransferase [Pseudoalteromonas piscicida]AXR01157.1 DegT/DnrJ/EryC1/StrS family aminotransferase [Pseudoalteromonas piscicida]
MKYPIVQPFLPELDLYQKQITEIFARNRLTNKGPCEAELVEKLKAYLGVEHILLVANGTMALHIAYQVMGITKAITTPFTFAATLGSLRMQNIATRFSDICPNTFNLDPSKLDSADLEWADALVPVHVFANPCDVEAINRIAEQYQLKVIYDAAHCFASKYKGESLLKYGDCATLSLHATKLFHTVEGGAVIFKHRSDLEKAQKIINFGQNEQQIPVLIGTNAKMSEMHAAMGLCVFNHIDDILAHRVELFNRYKYRLKGLLNFQHWKSNTSTNGSYLSVLFNSEHELLYVREHLESIGIQTRRYFFPDLNELKLYTEYRDLPCSKSISRTILCLPMYYELRLKDIDYICDNIIVLLNKFREVDGAQTTL